MSIPTNLVRRGNIAAMRAFNGGVLFWLCVGIFTTFVLVAVFAPLVAPYDPNATSLSETLLPSSTQHLLGTDQSGRDTFSRLLYGARTSLIGPLTIVIFSTILGVFVGLLAGWRGGWVDAAISRVLDILFGFPGLLVAMLAVALFGKGLTAPIVAMSIAYMPFVARLTRGLVVQGKTRPYIAAYRVQGFGPVHTAVRRLLPNVSSTVLAQATLNFGYALLDLTALSFLGLGVQPPTADWGAMVNDGRGAVLSGEPMSAVAPALAIVLVVVAFNVVGQEFGDRIGRRKV